MSRADAIVVLGCRIAPSGRPGPAAARRAAAAARAYLEGVAGTIVVSGGRRWGAHIEARTMRDAICAAGVPEGAVIEELWSLSTSENAVFSAAVLRRLGARRAAIVTCSWHMPRAIANFRAAGVDVTPLPAGVGPRGISQRIYLHAHETVCRWIDARSMRRADLFAEAAARGQTAAREQTAARAEVAVS